MKILNLFIRFHFLFLIIALLSCTKKHNEKEVEAAMQEYNRLLKKQDVDSISLLFTPDGELGDQAKGRGWIKKYLAGFANVHVLSQTSTSDSIKIINDTSFQKGVYKQIVVISPTDTLRLRGKFNTHWIWYSEYGWLIKRIETNPLD